MASFSSALHVLEAVSCLPSARFTLPRSSNGLSGKDRVAGGPVIAWVDRREFQKRVGSLKRGYTASAKKIVAQAGDSSSVKSAVESDVEDNNILPYCSIDEKKNKKSLGEMEQDFLEALQSFYFDEKPIMSNEEFDNLKEELTWEGSSVVVMSTNEQKFMEACLAYSAGKKIMSDDEYDALKLKLKRESSKVALEGPRCSLRSRKVTSDSSVDYVRMLLLNLPAVLLALLLVFFVDDITGFEITYLLELPEPYSFIFTWFVVLPATFLITQSITNVVVKDALILKGPCPNCGTENITYFGSILNIEGETLNSLTCSNADCGMTLKYDLNTRLIEVDQSVPPKKKKKPAAAKASRGKVEQAT